MRHVLGIFCGLLLSAASGDFVVAQSTDEVTKLVEQTKGDIEKKRISNLCQNQ